ncbi:MAG: bifunctional serine/threonine-protein kinase/formylglycine-generating enzyme family protein [Pseudomonadota bacterium]
MALIEPGQMLGKYRIERQIGAGGMSDVYQAMDSTLKRQVALKVLTPEVSDDPEHVQRFRKEVLAVAALEHPGIVTIFDVGSASDHQFYAMTLLPGGNLKNRLVEGPFSPERSLAVVRALALALDHAHNHQIVHRDIKPENVLFDRFDQPMLVDFGIARMLGETTRITAVGTSVGTPYYMSPEQAQADASVDARTDLYSLGVLLYEMLTGEVPYDSNTAVGIAMAHQNEPIPTLKGAAATLQPLLDTLLAKAPAQRPVSAAATVAIVDDLTRRLADQANAPEEPPEDPEEPEASAEPTLPPSKTQAFATFNPESSSAQDPETEFELPAASETPWTATTSESEPPAEPAAPETQFELPVASEMPGPEPEPEPEPEAEPEPSEELSAQAEVPETEFELPVLSEPEPQTDDPQTPEETETSFSARSQQLSIHADTSTQTREEVSEPASEDDDPEAAPEERVPDDDASEDTATSRNRDPRGQTIMAPELIIPPEDESAISAEIVQLTGAQRAAQPEEDEQDPWYGRPGILGLIGLILVALLIGLTRFGGDEAADEATGDGANLSPGDDAAPADPATGENLDALLLEVLESERQEDRDALAPTPPADAAPADDEAAVPAASEVSDAAAQAGPDEGAVPATELTLTTGGSAGSVTAEIEQLLRYAEVFRAIDQLTLPDGENAWEAYQAVLDLDATNKAALRGLAELQRTYVERSRSALAGGDRAAARASVERLRYIDPIHPDLPGLEAALASGVPAASPDSPMADQGQKAAAPAAAAEVETFTDALPGGTEGPLMVPLPGGAVRLADGAAAATLAPFALAKTEITVGQFETFVAATGHQSPEPGAGGCNYWLYNWRQRADRGWQSPGFNQSSDHPVVCVSYADARAYVDWLSEASGARYRLPTEAEWSFASQRDGVFWSSSRDACDVANVSDIDRADRHNLVVSTENVFACRDGRATTAPVATYQPSGDGFYDLLGNAAEWTADCWSETPGGDASGDCEAAPVRGGSWFERPAEMNRESRLKLRREDRFSHVGFRVLREL